MTFDDWFFEKLNDPDFRLKYGQVEDLCREAWDTSYRLTSLLAEQCDNDLRERIAAAEALLDSRAGKLLRKGKTFVVVAVDEPYFTFVFGLIRKQELKRGTWSEIDEQWYQNACDEWMHNEAAKGGRDEA